MGKPKWATQMGKPAHSRPAPPGSARSGIARTGIARKLK